MKLMIETLKSLVSSKSSADEIKSALSNVPELIAAADAEKVSLQAKRVRVLLAGDDAELAAVDEALASASRQIERLTALADALEAKLDQTLEESALADALAQRAAVEKIRDKAAKSLEAKWPKIGEMVVALLREIAYADAAVAAFNRKIDGSGLDVEPLQGAEEMVRQRPTTPEKVISSEIVDRLITSDGGAFEGSLTKAKFDAEAGGYRVRSYDNPSQPYDALVFKRRFRKETWLPPVAAPLATPLWATVSLPALVAGDREFWRARNVGSPTAAYDFFEAEQQIKNTAEFGMDERQQQVRFIPLPDSGADERQSPSEAAE